MNDMLFKFAVFMTKVLVAKGVYPPPTCQADAQAIFNDCIDAFVKSEGIKMQDLMGDLKATSQAVVNIIMCPGSTAKN